ncbi:hypothetical protein AAJP84_01515 [Bartonella schoenbuchensis]|uniref:hypothetical protein n=1 Tax=Bartonella schoenbuchensis TaxID=165694 RepID=UPI0031CCD428
MMNMENVCVGGNKFRRKTEKQTELTEAEKNASKVIITHQSMKIYQSVKAK